MSAPVLYPLRPVDTAVVRVTDLAHGRRRITIDHRPLPGISPAMLLGWFTGLIGTMTYGDQVVDRYHAWHPIDHIRVELARQAPNGGFAEGARLRIVEAFGGRPEYTTDEVVRIEKLDETGIRLVKRVGPAILFQLEHTWSVGTDGLHYLSVMEIGARSRLMTPVNRVISRRMSSDQGRAWVRHNVEEVGQLEYLLPTLADSGEGGSRSASTGG